MADALAAPPARIRFAETGAFAFSVLLVLLLCLCWPPRWETNDDVGMSMLAHGYGIADAGSPNIVFSNVVWGAVVRSLPTVAGVNGYALATLGTLMLVGAIVLHGLVRLGNHWLTAAAAATLMLIRPVLFPQFTVNAGLLAVAGLVCLCVYAHVRSRRALWCGVAALFLSYLIRSQELLLVLAVAVPLLWRFSTRGSLGQAEAVRRRTGPVWIESHWIALGVLALAIALAGWLDWYAYQAPEWRAFRELNLSRAPYTDFGATQSLLQRPDLLARYGYSANDITLVSRWFFVDPALANPVALRAMLADAGFVLVRDTGLQSGWHGVTMLLHPRLLPLLVPAALLALLRPRWPIALTWMLCIGAMFLLGFLGRPGVMRVYVPVISLLLIAPLLVPSMVNRSTRVIKGLLLIATVWSANTSLTAWRTTEAQDFSQRQALQSLPHGSVASWGSTFPLEAAYPVLGRSDTAPRYRLYSLGAFTLVPNSVAARRSLTGHGLVAQFQQPDGVTLFGNPQLFALLDLYCQQRLHGTPITLQEWQSDNLQVSKRRCAPP
ncbi:hypothetical protein [Xanthomonas campestris]|uniref:hypothetical protein n=1 Tax=Xanthomonas campestris TaxID=339 RepID=UPI0023E99FB4|nr:hypothetical protein [Xanthomonas campestris]